jgi:exonuclease VII large subunit
MDTSQFINVTCYYFIGLGEYLRAIENEIVNILETGLQEDFRNERIKQFGKLPNNLASKLYVVTYKEFVPRSSHYLYIVLLNTVVQNQLHKLEQLAKVKYNLGDLPKTKMRLSYNKRLEIYLNKEDRFKEISWDELNYLRIVRNCIEHAFGDVEKCKTTKPKLEHLATIKKGYSIVNAGEERIIDMNGLYCAETLKEVSNFFDKIFLALSK